MCPASTSPMATQIAFCGTCEGVLPFRKVQFRAAGGVLPGLRHPGLMCTRCHGLYACVDPATEGRRRAWRYLLYAAAAAVALVLGAVTSSLGSPAPGQTARMAAFGLAALLTLTCLGRGLWLAARTSRFESLESYEEEDLQRRLCPGMLRTEVIEELSRRGWRPGKIRSVLASLERRDQRQVRIEQIPMIEDQPARSF